MVRLENDNVIMASMLALSLLSSLEDNDVAFDTATTVAALNEAVQKANDPLTPPQQKFFVDMIPLATYPSLA